MITFWPMSRLGGEFMPPLDEGDLLYMPSALPGLGTGKVAELLQQTDRLIKTVPEVESVFGKAGGAESATDPAPLEMFETTIQFKPREQWRAPGAGMVEKIGGIETIRSELPRNWFAIYNYGVGVVVQAGPSPEGAAVDADPMPARYVLPNQLFKELRTYEVKLHYATTGRSREFLEGPV